MRPKRGRVKRWKRIDRRSWRRSSDWAIFAGGGRNVGSADKTLYRGSHRPMAEADAALGRLIGSASSSRDRSYERHPADGAGIERRGGRRRHGPVFRWTCRGRGDRRGVPRMRIRRPASRRPGALHSRLVRADATIVLRPVVRLLSQHAVHAPLPGVSQYVLPLGVQLPAVFRLSVARRPA
jgi:hypothetical protein